MPFWAAIEIGTWAEGRYGPSTNTKFFKRFYQYFAPLYRDCQPGPSPSSLEYWHNVAKKWVSKYWSKAKTTPRMYTKFSESTAFLWPDRFTSIQPCREVSFRSILATMGHQNDPRCVAKRTVLCRKKSNAEFLHVTLLCVYTHSCTTAVADLVDLLNLVDRSKVSRRAGDTVFLRYIERSL